MTQSKIARANDQKRLAAVRIDLGAKSSVEKEEGEKLETDEIRKE